MEYKVFKENPKPLYIQLKDIIREQIEAGQLLQGSMLDSERRLCGIYDISYITVRQALGELAKEGFLKRVPGRGTFVTKPELNLHSGEVIGIAIQTGGHVYGELSGRLISNLEAHDYYCVIVEGSRSEGASSKISSLTDRQVKTLVVDGHKNFPFEALDEYEGELIFINRNMLQKKHEACSVLSDYYKGGRLIAEHYLSQGFKKIIYVSRYPLNRRDTQSYKEISVKGACDVLKEQGIPEENLISLHGLDLAEKAREILASQKKPVAVWASSDSNAKAVYDAARQLGLSIPEDVSVAGYFNTPWCGVFYPELTSVSIKEDKIADIAADIILGKCPKEDFSVEPELVVRGSTSPEQS